MNHITRLKPVHTYSYRKTGNFPIILGIEPYKPENFAVRDCFKVQYDDGEIDYVPVSSVKDGHYEMITD